MTTTIYAIPGTFCDKTVWDELVKKLPSNFELVNIDIPQKSSISAILDSLEKQLPKEACSLLGFSFGGFLASAFALKYPDRVKKLMVVSDSLDKLTAEDISARTQFASYIKSEGFPGLSKEIVVNTLHPSKKDDNDLHNKILTMSQSMPAITAQMQLLATTSREDIYQDFCQLSIPTYIVLGDKDNTVNKETVRELAIDSNTINYQEIGQSGHFLPLEQPDELAKVLINWSEL